MRRILALLGLLALPLIGVGAAVALTPGEHVVCATASVPEHVVGVDSNPVATIPGASDTQCVTATDQTVTVTTTVTTTAPPTTTTSPPPPPTPTTGGPGSLFERPACTVYVSAAGGGNGSSQTSPTTLLSAYSQTIPGSTVCLLPGTYNRSSEFTVSRSGSASGYITYRSFDPANPAMLQATASFGNVVQTFASYVQFMDLVLDGNGSVSNGLHVNYSGTHTQHNRAINLAVRRTGAGGIVTAPGTDYFTAVGNKIWRFGDVGGWSSGISFHNGNGAYWADTAPGFHNLIVGNYIAGGIDNSSHDSDGNGIIEDLGGNVPPTLIANNVVYMNGGRCIHALQVSGKQYIVGNTCYKNGLDTRRSSWDEFRKNLSTGAVIANNIAQAWRSSAPADYTYAETSGANTYLRNLSFGGAGVTELPAGNGVFVGDPLFVNPPRVDPSAANQWQSPPRPELLGDSLKLQAGSAAIDSCSDPRNLPGLDAVMATQIATFAMSDIEGVPRPQTAGFDCGAYERG